MSRNWLGVAGRTVAAAGLVALLNGCNGTAVQDGDAGATPQTAALTSDDDAQKPKPGTIEIFGKRYNSTIVDLTQLLNDLQAKLDESIAIDKQLQGHLRNRDVEAFLRDYQRSQQIVEDLVLVHSEPFAQHFAASLQVEAGRKLTLKDSAKEVSQPFLNGADFFGLKDQVRNYVEARLPFAILYADITQNPTKQEQYAGLEYCCLDPEAQTVVAKLKSFGTNYTKEQRRGTSPVGSWKLMVVFDDERLKAMKSGEKERLPAGEFVELKYDEPSDMFSFCYTKRTKPNGSGNTTFAERKFQIVDLLGDGVLSGTDARLNGVHPDQIPAVNWEYKGLLQKTLTVVETRYPGKFIQ